MSNGGHTHTCMVSDIAEVSSVALGGAHLLPLKHSHSLNMGFSHAAKCMLSDLKAPKTLCTPVIMTPIINVQVVTRNCALVNALFMINIKCKQGRQRTPTASMCKNQAEPPLCTSHHHESDTGFKLTLSSCTPLDLVLKKKKKKIYDQLCKMTASWTFGHYPPDEFPLLAFSSTSQRKAAERSCDKVTDRSRAGTGGPWVKGGEWSRLKETGTLSVPNQKRCGTEFKAGMRQTSKLLEFCQCSLPPPSFFKEREKRRERGGEVNENQTHSPVWSGCEQWGGWCQEGFSPYLFLHFDISPSTSEGPFFLTFSFLRKIIFWFEQLSPIDKGMRPQEG